MEKTNSVLIVDDEPANIRVLSHILGADYRLYAVNNGTDAIEAAKNHAPDIVLLDVIMPGMDGYDVISALKASDETKDIPVIFITGLGNATEEEKGLALGAADYISKPFSPTIVKHRVLKQIEVINMRRELAAARLALAENKKG